ncbi:hypothetical protein BA724_12345 [Domibacillus iocasae]|uniref:Uncharacterized protein n=1 Tax=Domibacillus iocasae TaxID=1714016 RepID=A0A1E7DLJ3_9BACI|nr:hypothetical protein BA724_12345 [Domibacillus iocasae]
MFKARQALHKKSKKIFLVRHLRTYGISFFMMAISFFCYIYRFYSFYKMNEKKETGAEKCGWLFFNYSFLIFCLYVRACGYKRQNQTAPVKTILNNILLL